MRALPPVERPVLLVEDNIRDAELLRDALEDDMDIARIVHVRDGAAAVAWLEQGVASGRPLPLLILLDLKMPRMTGMELLAHLRRDARFRHIPVVMMTSSSQEQDLLGAYELGVNAYVCKPLDFEAFVTTVRRTLYFWVSINLLPQGDVA